jgi:hypothetical protein
MRCASPNRPAKFRLVSLLDKKTWFYIISLKRQSALIILLMWSQMPNGLERISRLAYKTTYFCKMQLYLFI